MHQGEAELRQAIADGAPLDQPVMFGETLLNLAILRRSPPARSMAKALLKLGADPMTLSSHGTAFHTAARAAETAMLKYLLARCPDGANVRDTKGRTPLLAGLADPIEPVNYKAGVPNWVLCLLAAGADVNVAAPGESPVFHRLLGKRRTVPVQPVAWNLWITALLNAGMDPMVPDAKGVPALYAAIATGRFRAFAQDLWAAGGTMDRLTPDGRDGWSFVPADEAVGYRTAWTAHEGRLLQTAARETMGSDTLPDGSARSRRRL